MTKKTFNEEMQETVSIPKHVLFAIRETASNHYQHLSLKLHNFLGQALTNFEKSEQSIFGISRKDKQSLIRQYFQQSPKGDNVGGWNEIQTQRMAAKKAFHIADHALKNKDFNSIHPRDFADEMDSRINELKKKLEKHAGMSIHFYDDDSHDNNSYNFFTRPM